MKYFIGPMLICILLPLAGNAQNPDFNQPYNSSYLAKYRLSPKIFNLLISPMYQESTVLKGKMIMEKIHRGETSKGELELIYDPFYDYGLSLYMVVHDSGIYDIASRQSLKRMVGKTNEKYRKIQNRSVINEDEVGLISDDGNKVVLGFQLEKKALPNYLKYLSNMTGKLYLSDGILTRIEMNLTRPEKIHDIQATEATQIIEFQKMHDDGYLASRFKEEYSGIKAGEAYSYINDIQITEYLDDNYNTIGSFKPRTSIDRILNDHNDTIRVKLERSLPFLGNAARKAGYELPLPFGVDVFTHFQQETLGFDKIVLDGDDLTNVVLSPGKSSAKAITSLVSVRGDVWLLPFVGVTVMGGYILGSTDITLALSEEVKEILGLVGVNAESIVFNTEVSGPMLGGGITLAGGYKNLFATVNAMYINQYVKEAGTDVDAYAITSLIGVRFPRVLNVMVGGQYQLYNSNISGTLNVEGDNIEFAVELKSTRWNWLIGMQRDFSNHWNGSIMVGFEPRPQATLVLGYRF